MKPRVSASPPPTSVGDDDDGDDGANDAEEEDSVDRTIGRSVGRHASVQHKKGEGEMDELTLYFAHNSNNTSATVLPPLSAASQMSQTNSGKT
jgi:hypothetical protein